MSDEFSRIAQIRRRLYRESTEVRIGIGDDAAVLAPPGAEEVVSVDAAVEGVHFYRDFAAWPQIGFRSLVAALSDLAAMGAEPRASLVALILPESFQDQWLYELADGIALAAHRYGAPVVGGNLSAGAQLSITSTVLGRAGGAVLTRSGARAGDRIYLTGTVGEAALGLRCLQAGVTTSKAARFVERWRTPSAKIAEGRRLLGVASAAIDVSDGVLQDLEQVCEAAGVGAEINADDLPLGAGAMELAQQIGDDAIELALSGGEDYELLFTAPGGVAIQGLGTCIGRIAEKPGQIQVRDRQGRPVHYRKTGYRHWRE